MTDLIGTIARARASMMVRGYEHLELVLGPDTWARLRLDCERFDVLDPEPRRLFDMTIRVDERFEGWQVSILPTSESSGKVVSTGSAPPFGASV